MPQPTPGDVHVNVPLTNISIAYMQDAARFIASRMFPNIPVQKQSDRYWTYDRGDFNRDDMEKRAPGAESSGGGYNVDSTPTYFCDVWAYHKDVHDQVRANEDTPLNSDSDATRFVSYKAMIRRERLFADRYFKAGVWATDLSGVASGPGASEFLKWSDAASTPIEDVRAGRTHVLEQTGFEPNVLVIGRKVYDKLVDHPDFIDRVKYGQTAGAPAQVNLNALASLFEVDEVLVSSAIFNAAKEGAAEDSQFIGGDHALLAYRTSTPGLMVPTAGYTFSWTGFLNAGPMGSRIKRFRMENLASDRIEIEMAFDQKVVGSDLGYFFGSAV